MSEELTFEKPGPGTWQLEDAHFSRPFSRWMQHVFPPAMEEGFGQSMAHYGALLDAPQVEPVNGFMYVSFRSVVGPAEADSPPPKLVFKLLSKVHPTLRRRIARMRETFETKRWRADLDRWDTEWKPARQKENKAIQATDPASYRDEELAEHLEEMQETITDAIVLHHRMDLCPLLPMGDFLAHAQEWTDRSPSELLELFGGASPMSAGAIEELNTLSSVIREDPDARSLLFSTEPPAVIVAELQERSDAVGTAMADWVDVVGYRITSGYDVADFYALEKPVVLVNTLRSAVEDGDTTPIPTEKTESFYAIREDVPPSHREKFDQLYEEARVTYRIRDERSLLDLWTLGLARRALLEAGRRLNGVGLLKEPDHAVDLTPAELQAGLRTGKGPGAEAVASRVKYRETHDNDDAPNRLGPEPPPAPPSDWLPDPAARGMVAVETMIEHLLESGDVASETGVVRGLAANDGTTEGQVRIVSGPEDFDAIQQGEILVAEATSPAFNVVLPLLGGIVTDNGGVLSHAAIVAREYGIPGVVGCDDATDRLETGMTVRVDGGTGTVTITS